MLPTLKTVAYFWLSILGTEEPARGRSPWPWTLDKEHRFVWIQGGQQVGETRIKFVTEPDRAGEKDLLKVEASRRYDRPGNFQRGKEVSIFRRDGTPVRFEETLDVSMLEGKKAHQVTVIEFSAGKARAKYTQAGTERPPLEIDFPKGAYLAASNAVEHWVCLAATLPKAVETHKARLLYPDLGSELIDVTFLRKPSQETLKLGTKTVSATRHDFSSPGEKFKGSLWLDDSGRLLQLEFPNRTAPHLALRVVLTP